MMFVNFGLCLKDNLEPSSSDYHISNLNYLYFHQVMVGSCFILLLGNILAELSKCNDSSRRFFVNIYWGVFTLMVLMQFLVLGNLWHLDSKTTLPFYSQYWSIPDNSVYSILLVRITTLIYFILVLIGTIFYLKKMMCCHCRCKEKGILGDDVYGTDTSLVFNRRNAETGIGFNGLDTGNTITNENYINNPMRNSKPLEKTEIVI